MKTSMLIRITHCNVISGIALLMAGSLSYLSAAPNKQPFQPVATYTVSGTVAEIVTATPDGNVLIYTDSESQELGFVSIEDPANPAELGKLAVAGEPTSVAVTPNGRFALAVVHGEPDHLVVID